MLRDDVVGDGADNVIDAGEGVVEGDEGQLSLEAGSPHGGGPSGSAR